MVKSVQLHLYCILDVIFPKRKFSKLIQILFVIVNWQFLFKRCKILLITYQCLQGVSPSYLQDIIVKYFPVRTLRSTSKSLLKINPTRTHFYGSRAFQVASAELWNNLPDTVKLAETVDRFKSLLKTHLFVNGYSQG